MELIDKEKVIAEIKKLYKEDYKFLPSDIAESVIDFKDDLLMVLDTLEVKEVDCDKEIGMYTTKELLRKRNNATNVFHLTQGDIDRIAKHFFELGFKAAQKGE